MYRVAWLLLLCCLWASPVLAQAVNNFVVILTDDQRWDTLWAMPIVQKTLIRRGVNFTNAFVSTPLCCPFRASFLSGGYYAHNTGVLSNELPNGGASRFLDTATLPLRLQQHGYATALIGKYLNGYEAMAPYIPPGWSKFVTKIPEDSFSSWTIFDVVRGSSTTQSGRGVIEHHVQYLTDYLHDQALAFLDGVGTQPFFLFFAPNAPHYPATPAPQDAGLFNGVRYRSRGYAETNRTDKPNFIQQAGPFNTMAADVFHRKQIQSLQAVDRAVGALLNKVTALGLRQNTVFVYTSDNGFLRGEHGVTGKHLPYEESLRVPLVVVLPGMASREEAALVVPNLDIPTMVARQAGLPAVQTDGLDLSSVLQNPRLSWRPEGIFLESFTGGNYAAPVWAGWRTNEFKYVEYATGEVELYDLRRDTYELVNVAGHPGYAALQNLLRDRVAARRGLAIVTAMLPVGLVGVPYRAQIMAWGGLVPYTWAYAGVLPEGLLFDPLTATIAGTPQQKTTTRLSFTVSSPVLATQRQEPQQFTWETSLTISP